MADDSNTENLEDVQGTRAPLQKIRRRAVRHAADRIYDFTDRSNYCGDSPIERILFVALLSEIEFGCHEHTHLLTPPRGERWEIERLEFGQGVDDMPLVVERQIQLDGWRVDFLISTRNWRDGKRGRSFLIVECDGHDFHERTKEQAAKDRSRDREFQGKGYTVFRFTGSEIWRDPCACADQILDWAVAEACF